MGEGDVVGDAERLVCWGSLVLTFVFPKHSTFVRYGWVVPRRSRESWPLVDVVLVLSCDSEVCFDLVHCCGDGWPGYASIVTLGQLPGRSATEGSTVKQASYKRVEVLARRMTGIDWLISTTVYHTGTSFWRHPAVFLFSCSIRGRATPEPCVRAWFDSFLTTVYSSSTGTYFFV